MDKIRVAFTDGAVVEAVAEKNADEIKEETLADELIIGKTLEFSKEWSINGDKVVISVEKI